MPPLYCAEGDDYIISTITILNHGSLEIVEDDIIQAELDYLDFFKNGNFLIKEKNNV